MKVISTIAAIAVALSIGACSKTPTPETPQYPSNVFEKPNGHYFKVEGSEYGNLKEDLVQAGWKNLDNSEVPENLKGISSISITRVPGVLCAGSRISIQCYSSASNTEITVASRIHSGPVKYSDVKGIVYNLTVRDEYTRGIRF